MDLTSIIRLGIAKADQITADLQVPVQHYAWIGTGTTYNDPDYDTPVTRMAIVEEKQKTIRFGNGQEILQKASISFLRPIIAHGAADRREPIDSRDKFVLPSGYTGPILRIESMPNNRLDSPYMIEVFLG